MKKIVFATNNLNKLKEIQELLKDKFIVVSLADIGCKDELPETSNTLEGNALQKANYVLEKYGQPCFADDTGLEIEALDNKPGVYSARYAGEQKDANDNMDKVLSEMKEEPNRKACFKTVIALVDEGKEHLFVGYVNGTILTEKHGSQGFGYDPIFQPDGHKLSFAEMPLEEKNKISHRALAVKKLVDFLG